MSESKTVSFLSPEEIATRSIADAAFIRHPESHIFRDRELRLRQLAAGHAMRDYLIFMADLAAAQHQVLQKNRAVTLPDLEMLQEAQSLGLAPLTPTRFKRSSQWRDDLQDILQLLLQQLPEGAARTVAESLSQAEPDHVDRQADRLLTGVMLGLDLGTAPLIGAALQVHWMRLIAQTRAQHGEKVFGLVDDTTHCPCCGGKPVASILRVGGDATGTRYLHCSLCQTQWHMVRIKCTHCLSTKGIAFQSLLAQDGSEPPATGAKKDAVQVETCDECGHYLKIVNMPKDLYVEPVADDLASLTLDLLVSDAGKQRHGVNFMLLFGAPDDDASTGASEPEPGG